MKQREKVPPTYPSGIPDIRVLSLLVDARHRRAGQGPSVRDIELQMLYKNLRAMTRDGEWWKRTSSTTYRKAVMARRFSTRGGYGFTAIPAFGPTPSMVTLLCQHRPPLNKPHPVSSIMAEEFLTNIVDETGDPWLWTPNREYPDANTRISTTFECRMWACAVLDFDKGWMIPTTHPVQNGAAWAPTLTHYERAFRVPGFLPGDVTEVSLEHFKDVIHHGGVVKAALAKIRGGY